MNFMDVYHGGKGTKFWRLTIDANKIVRTNIKYETSLFFDPKRIFETKPGQMLILGNENTLNSNCCMCPISTELWMALENTGLIDDFCRLHHLDPMYAFRFTLLFNELKQVFSRPLKGQTQHLTAQLYATDSDHVRLEGHEGFTLYWEKTFVSPDNVHREDGCAKSVTMEEVLAAFLKRAKAETRAVFGMKLVKMLVDREPQKNVVFNETAALPVSEKQILAMLRDYLLA